MWPEGLIASFASDVDHSCHYQFSPVGLTKIRCADDDALSGVVGQQVGRRIFTTKSAKHTKVGEEIFFLRALRVLRG